MIYNIIYIYIYIYNIYLILKIFVNNISTMFYNIKNIFFISTKKIYINKW